MVVSWYDARLRESVETTVDIPFKEGNDRSGADILASLSA
jgi:hypothetical protein